ncbi:MAG: glycerol-3-phosphate dehydrogenase subunit GlpB [Thermodesulfobacteriota bacterium]|nr:glycerol-3-phosphate dehydrogenase subunit GlpB [Thermodesulfobacteriota bacterium]
MNTRPKNNVIKTDLAIIGSGMAGLAAAVFAANRGISTVVAGKGASFYFASGAMDLMGVFPEGMPQLDPWNAIEQERKAIPQHPCGKINNRDISSALGEIFDFLKAEDLFYQRAAYRNIDLITSAGTLKPTYMVPQTMWNSVLAFETKADAALVDFTGLRIFSARQAAAVLNQKWPGIQSLEIDFPGTEHLEDVHPEHLARHMDIAENRRKLAETLSPRVKNVKYVGFSAMLGLYHCAEAVAEMEALLGAKVFEIPTPPVSVPGIRLLESFKKGLEKNLYFIFLPEMVKEIKLEKNREFTLFTGQKETRSRIESKGVILATGRLLGRGLVADKTGIRESLLNLPVYQPGDRKNWHSEDLFDPGGHGISRAGIETDDSFRPLDSSSAPVAEHLFAAGSILAHNDWTRLKCGSGVSVATAFAAVNNFISCKPA